MKSHHFPMVFYGKHSKSGIQTDPPRHAYWKGVLALGDDAIRSAEALVEQRIVACAQAAPDGRWERWVWVVSTGETSWVKIMGYHDGYRFLDYLVFTRYRE